MSKITNLTNARHIAHHRIEDEDVIYKKYELGRKLGQVKINFLFFFFYFFYII